MKYKFVSEKNLQLQQAMYHRLVKYILTEVISGKQMLNLYFKNMSLEWYYNQYQACMRWGWGLSNPHLLQNYTEVETWTPPFQAPIFDSTKWI